MVRKDNRWKMAVGVRCRFLPDPRGLPDEPAPPVGVWKTVDQTPSQGHWWILPWDAEARAWAASHPDWLTSGCMEVWSGKLGPADYIKI